MTSGDDDYRRRLIEARKKLGLSRREMARRLLTPWQTYRQWESAERRTPGVAALAAELLDRPRRPRSGSRWNNPALVARLGTLPDAELAEEIGVTREAIRRQRMRRNIPMYNGPSRSPTHRGIDWPREIVVALALDESTSDVARRLNIATASVAYALKKAGVTLRNGRKGRRTNDETEE